ncbi:MAG: hypothetical protein D9V44_05010 [Actinobacteria bacterium]|nr:MAG: hypothetical protein D9V44_05010 [Actinomycetota bacterium]
MSTHSPWASLPYHEWSSTKRTLQMTLQMLGKLKLALLPPQPEWLHTALQVTAHGWTTGAVPTGDGRLIEGGVDVFAGTVWLQVSDGRREDLGLPDTSVASVWSWFTRTLGALDVEADLWEKPQEVADTTPFSENTHDATFVVEHAQRFHSVLAGVQSIFEEFRSEYFGRSGVQFWWGAFDLAVLLFNGKHAVAPDDRGYIMRYDLDAEHLNAGFWPGDDESPQPVFYAYLVPQPPGCALAQLDADGAAWIEQMGEWVLPYEVVRTSPQPAVLLRSFLDSAYRLAGELGGWDLADFRYVKPLVSSRNARPRTVSER